MKQDLFQFFLVVPPGFEGLAMQELKEKFNLIATPVRGGLELQCSLENGLALNYLKIPARVLLRLEEFSCKDFPKLFNRLKRVKFTQFLPNRNFRIKVSSQKSRLLNEKKILKAAMDAFKPELNEKQFVHQIFIRIYDDICTVSLDTTGELLHKRGEKTLINQAPLRENIAAGLLKCLTNVAKVKSAKVIDPMCGSGTFLLEAAGTSSIKRTFAFQKFKNAKTYSWSSDPSAERLIGFDIDEKTVNLARMNLKNSPVPYEVSVRDVFVEDQIQFPDALVIVNPPYGKKIKLPKIPEDYYMDLLIALSKLKPLAFGCIVPRRYAKFKLPGIEKLDSLNFQNGGIPVTFLVFKGKV